MQAKAIEDKSMTSVTQLDRYGLLAVSILIVLSLSTLTIYPLVGYPYHEIPDFFAQLGLARAVLHNGAVNPAGSGSYLFFPGLFVLIAQLTLLTGSTLLDCAALLSVVLGVLITLMIFMILRLLSRSVTIAFVGGFIAIATNAAVDFIFPSPGYLNFTILLFANFLTWKFVLEDRRALTLVLPIVVLAFSLASGDPTYSAVYVIQLIILLAVVSLYGSTRDISARVVVPFVAFLLPVVAYYVYIGYWIIPLFFSFSRDFLSRVLSNLFVASSAQIVGPGSAVFQLWFGLTFWVSRFMYALVGGMTVLLLFRNLVLKRRTLGKSRLLVNMIVLSTVLASLPYFAIGSGVLGLDVGRFVQVSYPYMSLMLAFILVRSRAPNGFRKHRILSLSLVVILGLAMVLAYLPIHVIDHNLENRPLVYSAEFFTLQTGGQGRLAYSLPATAVVQFITGLELVGGPPPPSLTGPFGNLTTVQQSRPQVTDIVYSTESIVLEVSK